MTLIYANFQNELEKIFAKKKYFVLLIIQALICVMGVLLSVIVSKLTGARLNISDLALGSLTLFVEIIIPLIIFMAATDLFCAEAENKTIKTVLLCPINRFKIYISKISAITALAGINLMCVFTVSAILGVFTGNSFSALLSGFFACVINIFPMIILVLMACLINQFTNGSAMAMFLCIIIYVMLRLFNYFVPFIDVFLFTGYLQWHKLFLGNTLPFGALFSKILLLVSYGMIFLSSGYYLFAKKDL